MNQRPGFFFSTLGLGTCVMLALGMTWLLRQESHVTKKRDPQGATAAAPFAGLFTAFKFGLADHPRITRPAEWPERLTYSNADLPDEDLRNLLYGQWRLSYLCSGRPIEAAKLQNSTAYFNGIRIPMANLVFGFDGKGQRTNTDFVAAYYDDPEQKDLDRAAKVNVERNYTWSVSHKNGAIHVDYHGTFVSGGMKLKRINENGEYVFELIDLSQDDGESDDRNFCRPGEKFRTYLVRFQAFIS